MGIFVVLEGLDASGKTTVIRKLEDSLAKWNVYTIVKRSFFEVSDNLCHGNAQVHDFQLKLNELTWQQEAEKLLWFIPVNTFGYLHAAWYEMLYSNFILNAKKEYDIILVDGWWYKVFARIMVTSNQHYKNVKALTPYLPSGDLTFFLNVDPKVAWGRRNGQFNKYELGLLNDSVGYETKIASPLQQFISFQEKTKKNIYEILPNDFIQIETSNISIEQVAKSISEKIIKAFQTHEEVQDKYIRI